MVQLFEDPPLSDSQLKQDILARNLKNLGWLGSFRPMPNSCPLMGRKVHADLVPELLAVAWRCDGLGYAWECVSYSEGPKIVAGRKAQKATERTDPTESG
jgi:hypothetical protein